VRVNINDVACLGCRPMWFMSVLLLPPEISETELYELWSDLVAELRYYNIVAIGGHSEITAAVNTPVIVGYMVGEAVNDHFLDSRNIQPGDSILLWRGAAIEGTALLAAERFDDLKAHILPEQLETMKHLLDDPGICIWPAAKKLFSLPGLVAMHDPTEGGVATAIHELADIANCGVEINANSVPILSETLQLAKILEFDPLGLLASGSLLVVCKTESVDAVLGQLKGERVAKIGEFTKDMGRNMVRQDQYETLPRFDQDEIIKALKKKI